MTTSCRYPLFQMACSCDSILLQYSPFWYSPSPHLQALDSGGSNDDAAPSLRKPSASTTYPACTSMRSFPINASHSYRYPCTATRQRTSLHRPKHRRRQPFTCRAHPSMCFPHATRCRCLAGTPRATAPFATRHASATDCTYEGACTCCEMQATCLILLLSCNTCHPRVSPCTRHCRACACFEDGLSSTARPWASRKDPPSSRGTRLKSPCST